MLSRCVVILSCGLLGLSACGNADGLSVQLRSTYGTFDLVNEPLPQLVDGAPSSLGRAYRLVQCTGPIQPAWRAALLNLGIKIQGYVPENTLRVLAPNSAMAALGSLSFVRAVVDEPTLFKMDQRLVATTNDGFRVAASRGSHEVLIELSDPNDIGDVALMVQSQGGTADFDMDNPQAARVVHAVLPDAVLSVVAANPDVSAVELYRPVAAMNDLGYGLIQAQVVHQSPLWTAALHGEGQLVATCDVGVAPGSCFFPAGKIAAYENITPATTHDTSHGTHTAGTIAGDTYGNGVYDLYDGMAPAAKLYIQDAGVATAGEMDVPDDLSQLFTSPYNAGARIHSDSWGSDQNTYGVRERSLDQFVFSHPDFLVIVAAGNTGNAPGTINAPATAKNLIAAGALDGGTPENVAPFSASGPTPDGRIKPTLLAHGVQVVSASSASTCGVETKDGTSMATPMIAGAAALVRQYFTDGYYPSGTSTPAQAMAPSAALIKAVMLAGADSMNGVGAGGGFPNNSQGFGRVHLAAALHFPGDGLGVWVNDDTKGLDKDGDSKTVIQVQSGGNLHVALTWMDAPGAVGAAVELVNNLDLVVTGPDGSTYYGNALRNGVSTAGSTADNVNVEEIVYLPNAAPGAYTVEIRGTNVPMGPQPFAVVAAGSIASEGTTTNYLGEALANPNQSKRTEGCTSVAAGGQAWMVLLALLWQGHRMRHRRVS